MPKLTTRANRDGLTDGPTPNYRKASLLKIFCVLLYLQEKGPQEYKGIRQWAIISCTPSNYDKQVLVDIIVESI